MSALDFTRLRLRFHQNKPSNCDIAYPNEPKKQPQGNIPFLRLSFSTATSTRESFGLSYTEITKGRVIVQILTPVGEGDAEAHELADECAAIFRQWRWSSGNDSIQCSTPIVQIIDNDESWFQVNVSVPYESRTRYTVS